MTGTVDFSRYQVDVLLQTCVDEIPKYIFTPAHSTNTPALPLSNEIATQIQATVCIGDCSDHGTCVQGKV